MKRVDWKAHQQRVVSVTKPSIFCIGLAYISSLLLSRLVPNVFLSSFIALVLPSCLAYALFFRINSISRQDFDDRAWHSERIRGLRAGTDLDGDGEVESEERTKESAEWVNGVLRGVWPILNPDLYASLGDLSNGGLTPLRFSSIVDTLEDIMQASVPSFVVCPARFSLVLGIMRVS